MNLVDGGAFHEAVAVGLATPQDRNWERALAEARVKFDQGVAETLIPPEQAYLVEQHWQVVETAAHLYRENFAQEDYAVIQPECSFDVPLPHSNHHCVWVHHLEHDPSSPLGFAEKWGPPSPEAILEQRVSLAHDPFDPDPECPCWQPHRVVGKTDAIVRWKGNLWLLEHKTTAIQGPQFWDQWEIDIQPTTYIYGIWKATGIKPSGFVLDAIYKPSEAQVLSWNRKRTGSAVEPLTSYMKYERQAFLRTDEDLVAVERQYRELCDEWEQRVVHGYFPMSNVQGVCKMYNRKCDYWLACITHDNPAEFAALQRRGDDYVMEKLYQILPAKEPQ